MNRRKKIIVTISLQYVTSLEPTDVHWYTPKWERAPLVEGKEYGLLLVFEDFLSGDVSRERTAAGAM